MSDTRLWLEDLGLTRYVDAFEENEIDWELLPDLTDELLKEMDINAVGAHRFTASPNHRAKRAFFIAAGLNFNECLGHSLKVPHRNGPKYSLFMNIRHDYFGRF